MSDSKPTTKVEINLDGTVEIARVGVRRASAFLALGIKSANDETITSATLDSNFRIQFLPKELSQIQSKEIRDNFKIWTIGNGLRELDQSFALFLDEVYKLCIVGDFIGKKITGEAISKIEKYSEGTSVFGKLLKLERDYGFAAANAKHVKSFTGARNALAHNMGIVAERHCQDKETLKITWFGLDMVVGDKIISGQFEHIVVKAGEKIEVRKGERERIISIGQSVALSDHDLHEICLTYFTTADEVIIALQKHLESKGIKFTQPANINLPASETTSKIELD